MSTSYITAFPFFRLSEKQMRLYCEEHKLTSDFNAFRDHFAYGLKETHGVTFASDSAHLNGDHPGDSIAHEWEVGNDRPPFDELDFSVADARTCAVALDSIDETTSEKALTALYERLCEFKYPLSEEERERFADIKTEATGTETETEPSKKRAKTDLTDTRQPMWWIEDGEEFFIRLSEAYTWNHETAFTEPMISVESLKNLAKQLGLGDDAKVEMFIFGQSKEDDDEDEKEKAESGDDGDDVD
jgi:hypothetical protein